MGAPAEAHIRAQMARVDGPIAKDSKGGKQSELAVGLGEALQVTVPRDATDRLSLDAEIRSPLQAPIAAGERLAKFLAGL